MSVHAEAEHPQHAIQHVSHQFEDIGQQNEAYVVGMWTFLVTEIMFFGALFLALTVYRSTYPTVFAETHKALNVTLGTVNTFVLLFSSLTMVFAVRGAQMGDHRVMRRWLGLTILLSFVFLGIKGVEYADKFSKHEFPGASFAYEGFGEKALNTSPENVDATDRSTVHLAGDQDKAQIYFSLYFAMTGLHALHIIIGIVIMGTILVMSWFKHPAVQDYMPTEMTGLYWHFVDIVWIFLFPLLYLIGK